MISGNNRVFLNYCSMELQDVPLSCLYKRILSIFLRNIFDFRNRSFTIISTMYIKHFHSFIASIVVSWCLFFFFNFSLNGEPILLINKLVHEYKISWAWWHDTGPTVTSLVYRWQPLSSSGVGREFP